MKVKYSNIPLDIRTRYNLDQKVTNNGYLYIKIKKGMYGLRQAAILAYEYLQKTLKPYGYAPVPGTVGLWKHATRPIQFCLCVDTLALNILIKQMYTIFSKPLEKSSNTVQTGMVLTFVA